MENIVPSVTISEILSASDVVILKNTLTCQTNNTESRSSFYFCKFCMYKFWKFLMMFRIFSVLFFSINVTWYICYTMCLHCYTMCLELQLMGVFGDSNYVSLETYVLTLHLNCLAKADVKTGHNIDSQGWLSQGKISGKRNFFQVRERSGNFVDGQGNVETTWKARESQGI